MASSSKRQRTRKKRQVHARKQPAAGNEESPFGELMKLINFDEKLQADDAFDLLLSRPPIHKPEAGINPLVDAAGYLFSSMGQLARMRTCQDLPSLHKKLVDEISEFQATVKDLEYTEVCLSEYVPIATYILCATLDDIVVNTSWGGQGAWDKYGLLRSYHQEALSRENFLIILERFTQDQATFIDIMELIYICLNLGFKYSCHSSGFSPEQLQGIMHSLYKRIRIYRGNFNKLLSPCPLRMTASPCLKPNMTSRIAGYVKQKFSAKQQKNRSLSTVHALLGQNNESSYFHGVTDFLNNRTMHIKGEKIRLNTLPWLLLVGLPATGKTTLIENSRIKFIVNKENNPAYSTSDKPKNNWDWWITPHAVILDVPGSYLTANTEMENHLSGWANLLDLIQQDRGMTGVNGVAIVISCSEIMDKSRHPILLSGLKNCITCLHQKFGQEIPLNLIISKCDLMPGFAEFFDDYTADELTQPWGIRLPGSAEKESLLDIYARKFDLLIKQLNKQLVYRLHQEKDFKYHEKFLIKNFPLEMEKLKESTGEIIREFLNEGTAFVPRGIFLTSAMQRPLPEQESQLPQVISNDKFLQSLTILQAPVVPFQSCFIKQLLLGCLLPEQTVSTKHLANHHWLDFLYNQIRGI